MTTCYIYNSMQNVKLNFKKIQNSILHHPILFWFHNRPIITSKSELLNEAEYVEAKLREMKCEIVFNHGDSGLANIIYNEKSGNKHNYLN